MVHISEVARIYPLVFLTAAIAQALSGSNMPMQLLEVLRMENLFSTHSRDTTEASD